VTKPGSRPSQTLRLFFALWPSEPLRAALAAATAPAIARVDGDRLPPGNLHVTLVFLGQVPGARLSRLMQVGGGPPWPRVEMAFERVEYWVKPKVLVAIPADRPPAGEAVVERLWRGLEPLGFEREARPWQPHLTLVRRVRQPPPDGLAMAACAAGDWRLALVESQGHPEGVRYKPLADWSLQ
jgi:2'-5' RNA ligase